MEENEFYLQLIERYRSNQASVDEINVLFHLLQSGEIDDRLKARLAADLEEVEIGRSIIRRRKLNAIGIAASVLIIFSVSLLVYAKFSDLRNYFDPIKYRTIAVAKGEMRKLFLSDGTEVWVNAQSTLRFPEKFNRGTRELYLEGEAFFKVHHDEHKPFIIHSKFLNTTVLGTSFNVSAYKNEPSKITVKTGKVGVGEKAQGGTVMVTPAQQLIYAEGKGFTLRKQVGVQEYLGWKDGNLVFTGKTLKEMKVIIERRYNVQIHFKNDKLQDCSMVGSYHQESLKNILEAMRFSLSIKYQIKGRDIEISGGKCT